MVAILRKSLDALRPPYDSNPWRRKEVVRFLAQRQALTDEEWHQRFAAHKGISLAFIRWFRHACSEFFEYDLSAALPNDRLVEDLGMYDATWGDVDWDILEDYESRYGAKLPDDEQVSINTFGQLLEKLWPHAQKQTGGGERAN